MTLPKNIARFEVLLYLSLLMDALSAALIDHRLNDASPAEMATINLFAVVQLVALLACVWLAARHRRNWARWVLAGALGLSVISLAYGVAEAGVHFASFIDIISTALSVAGLYFAFTGDAQDWFQPQHP